MRSQHHNHQKKYFGREFSGVKDYSLEPWKESYVKRIKKDLLRKNYKKQSLLDIATGSGYVAVEVSKIGMKVIAGDLTPESIENLEKYKKKFKLDNLSLKIFPAENIPLPDNSVDYIVANAILEHIPDEKEAIKEWKRVLSPKGRMFITVPLKYRYVWPFLWPINYIHDKKIGHLRRYDEKELKNKFGMNIKKVYFSGHILKVFGLVLSKVFKNKSLNAYFEDLDRKFAKFKYGANNITVILEKHNK